jgi:hypothetical protein
VPYVVSSRVGSASANSQFKDSTCPVEGDSYRFLFEILLFLPSLLFALCCTFCLPLLALMIVVFALGLVSLLDFGATFLCCSSRVL